MNNTLQNTKSNSTEPNLTTAQYMKDSTDELPFKQYSSDIYHNMAQFWNKHYVFTPHVII